LFLDKHKYSYTKTFTDLLCFFFRRSSAAVHLKT